MKNAHKCDGASLCGVKSAASWDCQTGGGWNVVKKRPLFTQHKFFNGYTTLMRLEILLLHSCDVFSCLARLDGFCEALSSHIFQNGFVE